MPELAWVLFLFLTHLDSERCFGPRARLDSTPDAQSSSATWDTSSGRTGSDYQMWKLPLTWSMPSM
jgi:hypothetical protein